LFAFEHSSLVLGFELGETYSQDISEYEEIPSEYYNNLIRVPSPIPDLDYTYGLFLGDNPCNASESELCLNNPYGNDGNPYMYNPGLVFGGIAHLDIAESDDEVEVLEVYDYIVGHTNMSSSSQ